MKKPEGKLKKMRMPEEEKMDMGYDMGEESEGEGDMSEEDLAKHESEEPMPEKQEEGEAPADLEKFSDEELMAELKKRGLDKQMGEEENPEMDFGM